MWSNLIFVSFVSLGRTLIYLPCTSCLTTSKQLTFPSTDRNEVVSFLTPIGMETYAIFIKSVEGEEISWQTYGKPLKVNSWLGLLCTSFVIAALIQLTDKIMDGQLVSQSECLFLFFLFFSIRYSVPH